MFACGGRVLIPCYGFAGDAIDRVNQLIPEVVVIFSCSRPLLTLKTTVLNHMADELMNMSD